jgi:hydrogenase expression/formation protein HypD
MALELKDLYDRFRGPGCPVCVMPKERIDIAYTLSEQPNVILVCLGDMIKVPGSKGSLQDARARGCDVRFVYSPLDCLKIAQDNPDKTVIFFAIGFETTTPMTSALIDHVVEKKIKNILFHINHVTVPQVMRTIVEDVQSKVDAFIAPAHVSVITGSNIYAPFAKEFHRPIVVSGFEPVDVMESIYMIIKQFVTQRSDLEIQYKRSVTPKGNITAQALNDKYLQYAQSFKWRGLGEVPHSSLELKEEYAYLDAAKIYASVISSKSIDDHKLCICGDILKGIAKPNECKVFGSACTPNAPLGSCMVSSEGACAAYYRYGSIT